MISSKEIKDAIYEMLVMSRNGKKYSELLGKKYNTFAREINPEDPKAKLGFEDGIRILRIGMELDEELALKACAKIGITIQS